MQHLLRSLRARRDRSDAGFTLIELLVVVVIIGVLVAIAVPTYLSYREGAADKAAQSDIRSGISAVEAYYTNNGNAYPASDALAKAATTAAPPGAGMKVSAAVTLTYEPAGSGYCIEAKHENGSSMYYFNSATGGAPAKGTCP